MVEQSTGRSIRVYVGLGSNLGERIGHLCFALSRLRSHPAVRITRTSPVYEAQAHTGDRPERQRAYLNAVVEMETTMTPRELLALCHDVERAAGRDRTSAPRWASRTLDVDILIFDDVSMKSGDLTIPHPRLGDRKFVLRPLSDLAADLQVPAPFRATVASLLAACDDTAWIRRATAALHDECDDLT